MPKNIVLCTDGTWDEPSSDTNVVRLSRALLRNSTQVVFYDDGVGADGTPIDKLVGGAFGDGILQKVRDGYSQIAQVYLPGDKIFVFGFSRGAYTARSVAGMIAVCGLPSANFDEAMVDAAFNAYRNPPLRAGLPAALANYQIDDAKIAMVGVWDTVGSLGIPALFGGVEQSCQFLDTSLHPDVQNAFHAISVDERRTEFPATLWTGAAAPGQTLSQAYFAGVHCDVGGGYSDDTSLSDITLRWMVKNAASLGLQFDPSVLAGLTVPLEIPHALGTLHQSWDPLWGLPTRRTIATSASLADSVRLRLIAAATYRPPNLTLEDNGVPVASYGTCQAMTP